MSKKEEDSPKPDLSVELEVLKPDFKPNPVEGVIVTWLGHATVLVQLEGKAFLTDPVFAEHCSPISFAGPKRLRPPPCTVKDLPQIDAVVISHNHYDHLDYSTVTDLNERFGEKLRWYVPMGLRSWFTHSGCTNVVEKTWWDEEIFGDSKIKIISLPAQHWSLRSGFDRYKTLWCGWAIKGERDSFFFAGDTGYCPEFKNIGHFYGPFTIAAIPIGCYSPRWFMTPQHIDPAEAVKIHNEIRAKNSLAIHWGTYAMGSNEPVLEPKRKLLEEVLKANLTNETFFTLRHGESWTPPGQQ
jgi:N-acyl-phosphatidylethanolamine-hydrolysing phospholipase D